MPGTKLHNLLKSIQLRYVKVYDLITDRSISVISLRLHLLHAAFTLYASSHFKLFTWL